jgi:hypothetical protein
MSKRKKTSGGEAGAGVSLRLPDAVRATFSKEVEVWHDHTCATNLPMFVSTGGGRSKNNGSGEDNNNNLPPIAIGETGSPEDYAYLLVVQPAQLELLTDVLTDVLTEYRSTPDRKALTKDLQMLVQALKHASVSGVPIADVEAERRFQLFESNQTR